MLATVTCYWLFWFASSALQSPVQDKVRPLLFSLNASLYEKIAKKRDTVLDLRHLPVLSQTPKPIRTQVRTEQVPKGLKGSTVKPLNVGVEK